MVDAARGLRGALEEMLEVVVDNGEGATCRRWVGEILVYRMGHLAL